MPSDPARQSAHLRDLNRSAQPEKVVQLYESGAVAASEANLGEYLKASAPPGEPTTIRSLRKFKFGQSNPTYVVEFEEREEEADVQHRRVLRKKPPGKLLKSAHAQRDTRCDSVTDHGRVCQARARPPPLATGAVQDA